MESGELISETSSHEPMTNTGDSERTLCLSFL